MSGVQEDGRVERRFRKKPVEIEAVEWTGHNLVEIGQFVGEGIVVDAVDVGPPRIAIVTLEGEMFAAVGDWIIRGVEGEFYPCKPSIFAATYEPVAAAAPVGDTPEPMPVFTIKAKDDLALAAVDAYRGLCVDAGLTEQAGEVVKAIGEIMEWRLAYPELCHRPDHQHAPVFRNAGGDVDGYVAQHGTEGLAAALNLDAVPSIAPAPVGVSGRDDEAAIKAILAPYLTRIVTAGDGARSICVGELAPDPPEFPDPKEVRSVCLTPDEWASLVAFIKDGGTSASFSEARS